MITLQENNFNEEQPCITFEKYFEWKQITLWCKVLQTNEQFVESQKDVFDEILSDIVEVIQSTDDIVFTDLRDLFELKLHELNQKLTIFSQKMKSEGRYGLRGVMQMFVREQYVSALIWESSLMIFRDDKLIYSVSNKTSQWDIDLFSEIIEGDLTPGDEVLVFGNDMLVFVDNDDLKKITEMAYADDINFVDQLIDIVKVRVDETKIGFYQSMVYGEAPKINSTKLKKWMRRGSKRIGGLLDRAKVYTTEIMYGVAGVFVLTLLYRALSGFMVDANQTITDDEWNVVVDFTIEDIQRDISRFNQIEANSDEKIKAYNMIVWRLDMLEEKDLRAYDVSELRSIVEKNYKEWFNIKLVNSVDQMWDPVYTFSQQEKNNMWQVRQVFNKNGFLVSGEDGVLIGALSETIRGTLVSAAIGQKLESCYFNLLQNWLMCASSDGQIYNADKNGFLPVTTDDEKFPRAIEALGTRWSSNMYALTNDTRVNQEWAYIIKYQNKQGSQNDFWVGTRYYFGDEFKEANPWVFGSGGVASFAIDGSFLVRSKSDRSLYQLWREWATEWLGGRKLLLQWWDSETYPYSEQVKVLTTESTQTVKLFDAENDTLTVYKTNPIKSTEWGARTRRPQYFYMVNFDLGDSFDVIDIYVEPGEKESIYVLTSDHIYKLPLHEWSDAYEGDVDEY